MKLRKTKRRSFISEAWRENARNAIDSRFRSRNAFAREIGIPESVLCDILRPAGLQSSGWVEAITVELGINEPARELDDPVMMQAVKNLRSLMQTDAFVFESVISHLDYLARQVAKKPHNED